jgi:hypothetical protein
VIASRRLVGAFKEAADFRRDAKRLEEFSRRLDAIEAFGIGRVAEIEGRSTKCRDCLERLDIVANDAEDDPVGRLLPKSEIGVGGSIPRSSPGGPAARREGA